MKLTKLELTLKGADAPLRTQASSLLHGVIMEHIGVAYADYLHRQPSNHFSQYVRAHEDRSVWTICTLTEEAKEKIITPFAEGEIKYIDVHHKGARFDLIEKKIACCTQEELMERAYFGNTAKVFKIKFLTPTSFKVDGKYRMYPTVYHLIQSLVRKHDTISEETSVYMEGLIEQIADRTEVINYRLRSTKFPLEGIRIPSFVGEIMIAVRGPAQLAQLVHLLLRFGEYSGVGIKSALGMGAIAVE